MIGEELSGDTPAIGLSFIDLVSGGFGAAFFLFLIFVTLPITLIEGGGGGDQYIDLRLEWEGEVRLEFVLGFTPEGAEVERLVRFSDRNVAVDVTSGRVATGASPFWQDLFVFGYAGRGTQRMTPENGVGPTATLLRIIRPCPGRYRLFVNATGFTPGAFAPDQSFDPVGYAVSVVLSDDTGERLDRASGEVTEFGSPGAFRRPTQPEPTSPIHFLELNREILEFRSRLNGETATCAAVGAG